MVSEVEGGSQATGVRQNSAGKPLGITRSEVILFVAMYKYRRKKVQPSENVWRSIFGAVPTFLKERDTYILI